METESKPGAFNQAESTACRRLIELALAEDLGSAGDLTSQAIIPANLLGGAAVVARQPGILAGLPVAEQTFALVDPQLSFKALRQDGSLLQPGDQLAIIQGPMRSILAGERTALNFLQHLSGIATLTRRYVDAVAGLPCQILDTRKTTPGWRLLEKYAVRCGGGHNHRMGLSDGMFIKDNHLAALSREPSPIRKAVELALTGDRSVPVILEVDNLAQLEEALQTSADLILLDNMTPEQMSQAVRCRNQIRSEVELEASGGVTLDTVRAIAETGVDRISVGALTHSAPALDIALDYLQ
jgi:nicotinate-nucleotide pyrophosphorylase (carboxylating)